MGPTLTWLGLSDAEVLGSPRASTPAPGTMSDADVYGSSGICRTRHQHDRRRPRCRPARRRRGFVCRQTPVAPSPTGEDKPAFATVDPRERTPEAPATANILPAMGRAAVEGWQSGNPESPEQAEVNQRSLYGQYFVHPLLQLGSVPFRAMDAVGNALGAGAYELGNVVSPELGRDAYMFTQLLPAIQAGIPAGAIRPYEVPETRANPMMDAFDRAEAARTEQPSRPPEPDPAASGIARTQAQIGVSTGPTASNGDPGGHGGAAGACCPARPCPRICGYVPPSMRLAHRLPNRGARLRASRHTGSRRSCASRRAAGPGNGALRGSPPPPDRERTCRGSTPRSAYQSGGAAASRDGTDPAVLTAKTLLPRRSMISEPPSRKPLATAPAPASRRAPSRITTSMFPG